MQKKRKKRTKEGTNYSKLVLSIIRWIRYRLLSLVLIQRSEYETDKKTLRPDKGKESRRVDSYSLRLPLSPLHFPRWYSVFEAYIIGMRVDALDTIHPLFFINFIMYFLFFNFFFNVFYLFFNVFYLMVEIKNYFFNFQSQLLITNTLYQSICHLLSWQVVPKYSWNPHALKKIFKW